MKQAKTDQDKQLAKTNYSERDIARLATYISKIEDNKPPKFKGGADENKIYSDNILGAVGLSESCGTIDDQLAGTLLDQAQKTLFYPSTSKIDKCNIVIAALHGIKPKDELEGMLAVQMVGVHNLAMEFMKRAMLPEQTGEGVDCNVNRATKLLRTFTAQIEALNRHRGKGQQKVTVKHVHVNEGGQAIVGVVGRGGGKHGKRE